MLNQVQYRNESIVINKDPEHLHRLRNSQGRALIRRVETQCVLPRNSRLAGGKIKFAAGPAELHH